MMRIMKQLMIRNRKMMHYYYYYCHTIRPGDETYGRGKGTEKYAIVVYTPLIFSIFVISDIPYRNQIQYLLWHA
jgi:hypothetical protein